MTSQKGREVRRGVDGADAVAPADQAAGRRDAGKPHPKADGAEALTARPSARPRRLAAWLTSPQGVAWTLFAVLTVIYGATVSATPSLDVGTGAYGAWHLAVEGSRWIPADYLAHHDLREVWVAPVGERDVISRAPGVVALSLPAYLVFGGSSFSVLPGALTAAVATALAMTLFFLAVRTRLELPVAIGATALLALGTPVWSVAADGVWPHTLTVLSACGMMWGAATGRWWVVGLFGGLGLWGRSHFALVVAVLGVGLAITRRRPQIALVVGAISAAALAGTVLWSRWMFGVWSLTGSYRVASVDDLSSRYPSLLTNELGLLFAAERGIVAWSPVLLVLVPALLRGWRHVPDWARILLLGGLLYTLLQGFAQVFHGGDAYWGYRLGIELTVCAAPAFATAFVGAGSTARVLLWPLGALQIALIGVGAIFDLGGSSTDGAWLRNSIGVAVVEAPAAALVLIVLPLFLGHLLRRGCAHVLASRAWAQR